MLTSFSADPQSAINADRSGGISESGAYVGVLKQAETYVTQNGAQMMRFWFATKDGQETWTDLCVLKKDGTAAWGLDLFNSMMVCMGVQAADATPGRARQRNGQINENAMRIRNVENKPIGLLLQRENDTYQDQKTLEWKPTYRMNIVRAFDPVTRKTASEMLQNKEAHNIENALKTLKDKDRKPEQGSRPAAPAHAVAQAAPQDDDFPW